MNNMLKREFFRLTSGNRLYCVFFSFLLCVLFIWVFNPVISSAAKNPQSGEVRQYIYINGVINPESHFITGNEIILLKQKIDINGKSKANVNKYNKSFKGRFGNFRGIDIRLADGLYLMLYPNNFYNKPKKLKDYNFHLLYPYNFNRGYIKITGLSVRSIIYGRNKETFEVHILKIRFETKIPQAFGNFGHFDGETVLNGPFYPYISGEKSSNPPADINFNLNLKISGGYEAVYEGNIYRKRLSVHTMTNFLSFVLSRRFTVKRFKDNGREINFFSPGDDAFNKKDNKILDAINLLDKFGTSRGSMPKKINFVYAYLISSLWLQTNLNTNTLIVSKRFGSVFPYFYLYQKLNFIRGLIYLNLAGSTGLPEVRNAVASRFYSQELEKMSYARFKILLKNYSKKNPDIKNILDHFNFIQGVNTVINYPYFPLYYVYFTGYPELHPLKNGVYYYNNSLNLIPLREADKKIVNRKKNDFYRLFLSSAGGNIGLNNGKLEGYLNFTITKKYDYRNSYNIVISRGYSNTAVSLGYSKRIGRFFPLPQTFSQSVFGMLNLTQVNSQLPWEPLPSENLERVAYFSLGYNYNDFDYNVNPTHGSSLGITYNIATPFFLSPFTMNQFMAQYKRVVAINECNIMAFKGVIVYSPDDVPAALDYNLGGINGLLGIPEGLPYQNNDMFMGEADYRREIIRGMNIGILYNLLNVTSLSVDISGGGGEVGDSISSIFNNSPLFGFLGAGIHLETYFFGIYPRVLSFYAARGFGSSGSDFGMRYYIGIDQLF